MGHGRSDVTLQPLLDSQGRLAADVRCRQCRYNLRGLEPDATCPECGASIKPFAVSWSEVGDPASLGRVLTGLDVCLGMLAATLAAWLVSGLTGLLFLIIGWPVVGWGVVEVILVILPILALAVGVWRFTTPLHGPGHPRSTALYRRTARGAQVAVGIFLGLVPVAYLVGVSAPWQIAGLFWLAILSSAIGLDAACEYARRLIKPFDAPIRRWMRLAVTCSSLMVLILAALPVIGVVLGVLVLVSFLILAPLVSKAFGVQFVVLAACWVGILAGLLHLRLHLAAHLASLRR